MFTAEHNIEARHLLTCSILIVLYTDHLQTVKVISLVPPRPSKDTTGFLSRQYQDATLHGFMRWIFKVNLAQEATHGMFMDNDISIFHCF